MYHFEFDEYLERFESLISNYLKRGGGVGSYTEHIIDDRFANFLTDLGTYYIRKDNIQRGSKYILESLEISYTINNIANIVRCCTTHAVFSLQATSTGKLRSEEGYALSVRRMVEPRVFLGN